VKGHERQIVEKGFEQDRLDYWAMRNELLAKYSGKSVAVHKGRVVAVLMNRYLLWNKRWPKTATPILIKWAKKTKS
jgi:hypothetical protein